MIDVRVVRPPAPIERVEITLDGDTAAWLYRCMWSYAPGRGGTSREICYALRAAGVPLADDPRVAP